MFLRFILPIQNQSPCQILYNTLFMIVTMVLLDLQKLLNTPGNEHFCTIADEN